MTQQPITKNVLASVAVLGLVGTGAALHAGLGSAQASPGMPLDGSIADVTERTIDSVVNISNSHIIKTGYDFDEGGDDSPFGEGPSNRMSMSKGSGVIINSTGRILTNAHVVDGADELVVKQKAGYEMKAKVVGKDSQADLAVIQLKGTVPALHPIALGDSNKLRLGD